MSSPRQLEYLRQDVFSVFAKMALMPSTGHWHACQSCYHVLCFLFDATLTCHLPSHLRPSFHSASALYIDFPPNTYVYRSSVYGEGVIQAACGQGQGRRHVRSISPKAQRHKVMVRLPREEPLIRVNSTQQLLRVK